MNIRNIDATSKREFFVGGVNNPESAVGFRGYDYYDTLMTLSPAANTWYTYRQYVTKVLPAGFYEVAGNFAYSVVTKKVTFVGEILANNNRIGYCSIYDAESGSIRPISGFREIELTAEGTITAVVRFKLSAIGSMSMHFSSLKVVRTR